MLCSLAGRGRRRRFCRGAWDGRVVTVERLREWRGVKPVADRRCGDYYPAAYPPPEDEFVVDAVADHVGRIGRADLAARCYAEPLAAGLDADACRPVRRERLNSGKEG